MELVSGPDVGGGFLFQLTRERGEPLAEYTVHAQEGGLDGGHPPAGTPERVGFALARSMCPIGGRRCFHRTFRVPIGENTRVRFAYNRLRFVIGPMLEQRAGQRAVPFEEGASTTLSRLAQALGSAQIPWMVGGSSAAAIAGVPLVPHDLDLLTTHEGVDAVAAALEEFLIEPPAETCWSEAEERRAARAFVGTLTDGLPVEWAEPRPSGAAPSAPVGEWTGEALERARSVPWRGLTVPVAPIEFALANALRRSDEGRIRAIVAARPPAAFDARLLESLLTDAPAAWARGRALATGGPARASDPDVRLQA